MNVEQWPSEVLAGVAGEVVEIDDKIRILASEMMQTMYEYNGIGLAAPQVGVPLRIIVGDVHGSRFALVNPEILKSGGEQKLEEGCLSFAGKGTVLVPRAKRIKVRGFGMSGDEVTFKCDGLLAACIQHEIDHLDGITLHHKGLES